MSIRRKVGKVARYLPVTSGYLRQKSLKRDIAIRDEELQGHREAIARLEARNDEWAAEVRQLRGEAKRMQVLWPVHPQDLIDADYRQPMHEQPAKRHKGPYVFNWVIPPVGSVSGGHAVIFHMINFLESQGHTCRVYIYDPMKTSDLGSIRDNLKNHHPIKAELFYNEKQMKDCDGIFATSWSTAYPVFNFAGVGKKFYFVQDYEAWFDVAGTYNTLADNTYKMGLHVITTSPWCGDKFKKEYGVKSAVMELAVTQGEYSLTNTGERKKIIFYARPVTPRRGFELGVLALEIFHKEHPEYEINFIGWDTSLFDLNFPYVNNGILGREELNELYNQSAAALALSFTSMSLLPVELMAAGCKPVVNDSYYTRMVGYADGIEYAEPNPQAIADAIYAAANPPSIEKQAKQLSKFSTRFNWDKTDQKFISILQRELS